MQAPETCTCLLKTSLTSGHSRCASRRCLPLSARKAGAAEPHGGATPASSLLVFSCSTAGAGRGMNPSGRKYKTPGPGSISLRCARAFVRPWAGQGGCTAELRAQHLPIPCGHSSCRATKSPGGVSGAAFGSLCHASHGPAGLCQGCPRTGLAPGPVLLPRAGRAGLPNRKGWGWAWV